MYSHIFIDESGEFGLGKKSTQHLIVTVLKTNKARSVEKAIKKIWRANPNLHMHGELHANETPHKVVRKTLSLLMDIDIECDVYVLDKSGETNIHQIYYKILVQIIKDNSRAKVIHIDKRDTDAKRERIIGGIEGSEVFDRASFSDSKAVKQIQMTDFVSWSAFRYIEYDDNSFLEIVSENTNLYIWDSKQNKSLPL